MAVKVAVIYYSATGTNYHIGAAVAEGAQAAGAEVRLRRVRELAPPEAVNSRPEWRKHLDETKHILEATLADLEWADAYVLGSPTRFGSISSQMKQFIDTTGPLWAQGKLANKAAAAFTSTLHLHSGQEATILAFFPIFCHWGSIIVPPGATDDTIEAAGGNPYGVSATVAEDESGSISSEVEAAARYLGRRVAIYGSRIAGEPR